MGMSNSNKTTVESYEKAIDKYIQDTVSIPSYWVTDWLNESLRGLDHEARILEIGSAFGRDAKYIESLGYKVEKTDAVQGFISILQKEDSTAHYFNAINDEISDNYDLVFANAVFLHFTRDETESVSKKILNSLNNGGRFAISLKQGNGEEWSSRKVDNPRYFCYWQKDEIQAMLYKVGFSNVTISIDGTDIKKNNIWLMIVATK